MSSITVESLKPISGAGNLKGFACVNISNRIRISDIRIIRQEHQKPWVSMPSRAYESNGERRYAAIIELLDEQLKAEVAEAVLAEFSKLPAETVTSKPVPQGW